MHDRKWNEKTNHMEHLGSIHACFMFHNIVNTKILCLILPYDSILFQEQLYEEERRRKALQEEADNESRKHSDFFM